MVSKAQKTIDREAAGILRKAAIDLTSAMKQKVREFDSPDGVHTSDGARIDTLYGHELEIRYKHSCKAAGRQATLS